MLPAAYPSVAAAAASASALPLPPPRCLGMDKASLECSAAAAGRSDVLSECSLRTIEGGRQGKPKVEDCAQYLKFPPKKSEYSRAAAPILVAPISHRVAEKTRDGE